MLPGVLQVEALSFSFRRKTIELCGGWKWVGGKELGTLVFEPILYQPNIISTMDVWDGLRVSIQIIWA